MGYFDTFYAEATNTDPPTRPFLAVWVHPDGRCLGMTGSSQHRLSAVPSEFVRDNCPLDETVDIYVIPSKVSNSHPNYRAKAFEAPR